METKLASIAASIASLDLNWWTVARGSKIALLLWV
jgi:hypothetical protein